MAHKTIVLLIMLCLFLAACDAQGEVNTQDIVDSPEVTESPREESLPVVDYDAVPMTDVAREQLSALRVQDLHGEHVVGVNSEGEIILIELATGQESTISSEGVVWQDNRNSEQRSTDLSGCGNCPDNRFDLYLYLYDFKDKDDKGKPIVEDKGNNSQPQIFGNRVVWQSYREDMNADLYMLELDSGEIRRITETPFSENHALLSEDRLLWTVKQDCDVVEIGADNKEIVKPTGVYVLDFKTNKLEKLTDYKEPFAWIDQNTVMISEGCMAGWEVYTMTFESAELTQEAEPEAEASTGYQLVQSIASCRFSMSYCAARMKHLLR